MQKSLKYCCKVSGKKDRSRHKPKGKGKGFGGCKRKQKTEEKTLSEEREFFDRARPGTSHEKPYGSDSQDSDKQPLSSSAKKMKLYRSIDESLNSSNDESFGTSEQTGYRLIDLKNLSSSLSVAHKCNEGEKIVSASFPGCILCNYHAKGKYFLA